MKSHRQPKVPVCFRHRRKGNIVSKTTFKPGQTAPSSGQYKVGTTNREVTMPKGHTFPPSKNLGSGYTLVDRTKNNSGK